MAQANEQPTRTTTSFRFYAAGERLYARNIEGKVVDLGRLARHADGSWHYVLDGNKLAGGGTPTPETAMADAARRMGFLYLDGQFTALEDARSHPDLDLSQAPAVEVAMDELQRGERMEDARV